jgi:F-type H+-transporting ATPase subunit delta
MAAFAIRYARALADVIAEANLKVADIQAQLNDFGTAWHESPELREVFLDPSFPAEQKVAILDKLNGRLKMSQQARNFVAVLINHDRLGSFDEVMVEFGHEMYRRMGIAEVEVTTARKLDDAERRALEEQVAGLTKKQVTATFHEDSSLVGGAIVRVGSTVYDGSVRGRLDRLKDQLTAS